jgi:hypothetical protein
VEEVRERYKGFLVRQDPRCYQWKIHQAFPRPIRAPDVKPIDVNYMDIKEFNETMLKRHIRPGIPLYAKREDLLKRIDGRVEKYIEAQSKLDDESTESPWQKAASPRKEPKATVPKVPKRKNKKSD